MNFYALKYHDLNRPIEHKGLINLDYIQFIAEKRSHTNDLEAVIIQFSDEEIMIPVTSTRVMNQDSVKKMEENKDTIAALMDKIYPPKKK